MSNEEIVDKKIRCESIKVGDIMALTYYVKVKSLSLKGESLKVEDLLNGSEIQINGKEIIENSFSSDQFLEEKKVIKTEAAELLVSSANRPISVSFEKLDKTERTIRGRLIKSEPLLGRSMVEDLDLPLAEKNKVRLVDHRTINWIILENVKYVVKGK